MSDQPNDLIVVRHHGPADREAILMPLISFNLSQIHTEARPPLAILIRNKNGSETIGGLWGRFTYDWLFVELLFVPEQLRGSGIGRQIMEKAEQTASSEGCVGIWLDTFEFQAQGFYEKLGYSQFGVLEDHPRGKCRLFLQKRLISLEVRSN